MKLLVSTRPHETTASAFAVKGDRAVLLAEGAGDLSAIIQLVAEGGTILCPASDARSVAVSDITPALPAQRAGKICA